MAVLFWLKHSQNSLTYKDFYYDSENRLVHAETKTEGLQSKPITLKPGWNVVGLSLSQSDGADLKRLLSNLDPGENYLQISYLPPGSSNDIHNFLHYVADTDFNDFELNSTPQSSFGQAYEIYLPETSSEVTVSNQGFLPPYDVSLTFKQGLNFFSLPIGEELSQNWTEIYLEEKLQQNVDYSEIYHYNNETADFEEYTLNEWITLKPNQAYFLDAIKDCSLKILTSTESTDFYYDGDGGRVRKHYAKGTDFTDNTYIGSLYEIVDSTLEPDKARKHIFLGDTRIATIETDLTGETGSTGKTYFFHGDHLGSSNLITDESGNVVQYCEYSPYGEFSKNEVTGSTGETSAAGRSASGGGVTNHYFTGKELDSSTNLYFYGVDTMTHL